MASYTNIFVTMSAVCILLVKAEITYEFVTEKPDDYPNFDDNPFVQKLAQSGFPSRVKRETPDNHCGPEYNEKLCCAEREEIIPYVIKMKGVNLTVIQTPRFFTQSIPKVSCKFENEDKPCFKDFRNTLKVQGFTPKCKSVRGAISVLVYENKNIVLKNLFIGVECSCILE